MPHPDLDPIPPKPEDLIAASIIAAGLLANNRVTEGYFTHTTAKKVGKWAASVLNGIKESL